MRGVDLCVKRLPRELALYSSFVYSLLFNLLTVVMARFLSISFWEAWLPKREGLVFYEWESGDSLLAPLEAGPRDPEFFDYTRTVAVSVPILLNRLTRFRNAL